MSRENGSISRRAFGASLASITFTALARPSFALPRLPIGGKIKLTVPWPLASIDPHRLDDPAAAIFGNALFDSLYTLDAAGEPIPALADKLPESAGPGALRVTIRDGLTTAHGSAIDARDASLALARARSHGAAAWLAPVASPKREGDKSLVFAATDPVLLARVLASPITAIVPLSFDPTKPDGTGPFRVDRKEAMLAFTRNARAALGPSLLDEIDVSAADDLAAGLRAFESGAADVGWLGTGLHEPRAGSKPFDAGAVGWAVLVVGKDGGTWDAPGIAQRVCDGIVPSRLAYLGVGAAWPTTSEEGWSGPPVDLLVVNDAPWLVELARAVAASISRPGHEVTPRPLPPAEFATRKKARSFALAIDLARSLGPGALAAMTAIASADPSTTATELAKHPPKVAEANARSLTRLFRAGVLGEIRVQGGRIADLTLPAGRFGVDWATATRARKHP
ncbi:MAG TPA: ABC transporter substrate-binding protein [Polyangiaceae bacterium]